MGNDDQQIYYYHYYIDYDFQILIIDHYITMSVTMSVCSFLYKNNIVL